MNKSDFFYQLPERLIAQTPVEPRDSSRLLVYDKNTDEISHRHFYDLPSILRPDDVLVINNTKVMPARITGIKRGTGAKITFLLHKRVDEHTWQTLCAPAKRAKIGSVFDFSPELTATVVAAEDNGENGDRTLRFEYTGVFEEHLEKIGEAPLPHYIHSKLNSLDRYQTVYAKDVGSSAAPTAGLHFTPRLMEELKAKGITFVEVLLHVGLGTFLPVKAEDVQNHKMHSEYYCLTEAAASAINSARAAGRRIIAVGTTSVRVLESTSDSSGTVHAGSGETSIFIYPPYKFKAVDGLITNFHLPESTLIMLVSAFLGREKTLEIYKTAVEEEYRFFSFGDACAFL